MFAVSSSARTVSRRGGLVPCAGGGGWRARKPWWEQGGRQNGRRSAPRRESFRLPKSKIITARRNAALEFGSIAAPGRSLFSPLGREQVHAARPRPRRTEQHACRPSPGARERTRGKKT